MTETGKKPTREARERAAPEILANEIERRAYEKFAARGYAHGADFDDWRQAEEELTSEVPPKPKRSAKAAPKAAKAADAAAAKSPARRTRKQG